MSKLSAILISASLFVTAGYAADKASEAKVKGVNPAVVKFLEESIGRNPSIAELKISVTSVIPVEEPKGWDAYVVMMDAKVKSHGNERDVQQQKIYFVNGDIVTPELHNVRLKRRVDELIAPSFDEKYYTKHHLIYGNANAKHKVAIFSDPLCPFCRRYVPEALDYMKERPKEFAVYYYHLPLPALHPAAVTLTKAAIVAEHQGRKEVIRDLYKIEIDPREKDDQKILDAFNKTLNTKVTLAQIADKKVVKQFESDQNIAMTMMVSGTPTVFFDGKKDPSKNKYKEGKK